MIKERINERMNTLQAMMEGQVHVSDPARVEAQIAAISPYWAHLSDEDKDYMHCARWAVEKQEEWNV